MAATVLFSFSYLCSYASNGDIRIPHPPKLASASCKFGTTFATGSPLFGAALVTSDFCCLSTNGSSGVDIWLGRFAMVGFAAAISVEIATGKGLREAWQFMYCVHVDLLVITSPLPTVALAVTALVGVLTAVFIFQSASKT